MDKFVAIAVGAAWLAIFVMLIWGIVSGLRRQLRNPAPLPFFGVLERRGLTVAQVEEQAGLEQLVRAVGRCAGCEDTTACNTRACPNEACSRGCARQVLEQSGSDPDCAERG